VDCDTVEVPRRLIEELVACLESARRERPEGGSEPQSGEARPERGANEPYGSRPGAIPNLERELDRLRSTDQPPSASGDVDMGACAPRPS
jgi:hypothetical protein